MEDATILARRNATEQEDSNDKLTLSTQNERKGECRRDAHPVQATKKKGTSTGTAKTENAKNANHEGEGAERRQKD